MYRANVSKATMATSRTRLELRTCCIDGLDVESGRLSDVSPADGMALYVGACGSQVERLDRSILGLRGYEFRLERHGLR